jgi:hypothetical protein
MNFGAAARLGGPMSGTLARAYARTGGWLYLIIIVVALFAEAFVRGHLIEWGDAAKTAHNITNSPFLWRLQFAGNLIVYVCDVSLAVIFYVLLRPVNEPIALLAAFFHVVFASGVIAGGLGDRAALPILTGAGGYLNAFSQPQLQAAALFSIQLREMAFVISNIFFGLNCILLGYLVIRAAYFPSLLGVLLTIAGSCYVIYGFTSILLPAVAQHLFPWILLPGFVSELSLCLWLIIVGLSPGRWTTNNGKLQVEEDRTGAPH